jgi:UDP-glucose 4-epimerase
MVRVQKISNISFDFVKGDIRDSDFLRRLFEIYCFDAVIHFAGLKAVGESVNQPLTYYDGNVTGTITLLKVMNEFKCKSLVFSSSATVYGDPASNPIREDFTLSVTNPYGASKLMVEDICRDLCKSDAEWGVVLLRYFNPVGAHESGLIGEDPKGIPNNLIPYMLQVASGLRQHLNVFGSDYPTTDGTGVRDYIHVVDLARGHIKALDFLNSNQGALAVNLGTGKGHSVLDMIRIFSEVSGRDIPYNFEARRQGDIAECFADPSLAYKLLGWEAEFGIEKMCEDAWRWQSQNPNGYK